MPSDNFYLVMCYDIFVSLENLLAVDVCLYIYSMYAHKLSTTDIQNTLIHITHRPRQVTGKKKGQHPFSRSVYNKAEDDTHICLPN